VMGMAGLGGALLGFMKTFKLGCELLRFGKEIF